MAPVINIQSLIGTVVIITDNEKWETELKEKLTNCLVSVVGSALNATADTAKFEQDKNGLQPLNRESPM